MVSDALTHFVFSVAVPTPLFGLMSDFSRLPPVDARLLIAFFGSCLVVFVLGRLIAHRTLSWWSLARTGLGVIGNPVVASILA